MPILEKIVPDWKSSARRAHLIDRLGRGLDDDALFDGLATAKALAALHDRRAICPLLAFLVRVGKPEHDEESLKRKSRCADAVVVGEKKTRDVEALLDTLA